MNIRPKSTDELKKTVRDKYAQISRQSREQNAGSCCGAGDCCDSVDYSIFAEDYTSLEGYSTDADLGLGCGLPTEFARITEGDTVVDLGSGAGNDCFVARRMTGATGRVIGLDMTKEMVEKAKANAEKLGYGNVEFFLGDIEAMPLEDNLADIVLSNCVLNLVPDKKKAFSETLRILKPGGHFSISDVVTSGELPRALKEDAEMYAGCVAGAIDRREYLSVVEHAGFVNLKVQKQRPIELPDELLRQHLSDEELNSFRQSDTGIFSITLFAEKPHS